VEFNPESCLLWPRDERSSLALFILWEDFCPFVKMRFLKHFLTLCALNRTLLTNISPCCSYRRVWLGGIGIKWVKVVIPVHRHQAGPCGSFQLSNNGLHEVFKYRHLIMSMVSTSTQSQPFFSLISKWTLPQSRQESLTVASVLPQISSSLCSL
jgi:hypothetical protein